MSTTLVDPAKMIRLGAPRLIHSGRELAAYTKALFDLTAKPVTTASEDDAIALLTLLIDQYESRYHAVPDSEPADVLRFLLDQNGLTQRDIVNELGSETTVSLVLSGRRQLTRDHILRLSRRFHVAPSVFFPGI